MSSTDNRLADGHDLTEPPRGYRLDVIRRLQTAAGVTLFAALVAGCTATSSYVSEASSTNYSALGGFGGFGATAAQLDRE